MAERHLQAPLEDERQHLIAIAGTMAAAVPALGARLGVWRDHLQKALAEAPSPLAAESALDQAVRALRHVWLAAAASSTSKSYRSPAEGEKTLTPAGRFHNFGYERDLQPVALERRCIQFFDPPPPGWSHDHVLFSSGQAAMNALLTLLSAGQERRRGLRHEGCYFETVELLGLYRCQFDTAAPKPEIVLAEPVWSDGKIFGAVPLETVAANVHADHSQSIIIDSTLAGLDDGLNGLLSALDGTQEVFRLHSGLKLFQAGLELADVGILSLYGSAKGDALRHIRTLHGSGLRFAEVAALELPLFLDSRTTRDYEDAIFRHNAALAEAARHNPAFAVSFPPARAPFVIFNLPDPAAYDGLDEQIAAEAARRSLVFTKGGSFGFRGHRFETVRPEGKPPFLRVAMGARGGPSLDGVLDLLRTFRP